MIVSEGSGGDCQCDSLLSGGPEEGQSSEHPQPPPDVFNIKAEVSEG